MQILLGAVAMERACQLGSGSGRMSVKVMGRNYDKLMILEG